MSFSEYDQIINHYLDKGQSLKDQPNRDLITSEYLIVKAYQRIYKEMNLLITEVLAIAMFIDKLGNSDLNYLVYNLYSVRGSLLKQRNKSYVVLNTFLVLKPNDRELAAIKRFINLLQSRIEYVRASVIPYNLELTPIQEYLEICQGKKMREDLYDWFGGVEKIAAVNSGGNSASMEQYLDHILDTIDHAGKTQDYKDRIAVLVKRRTDHFHKVEQEKLEKRQKKQQENGSVGMMEFHKMFNRAVFDLRGCERINMPASVIKARINEYGRDCFFVLCCYVYGNHFVFRYLGEDDELVASFAYAHVF